MYLCLPVLLNSHQIEIRYIIIMSPIQASLTLLIIDQLPNILINKVALFNVTMRNQAPTTSITRTNGRLLRIRTLDKALVLTPRTSRATGRMTLILQGPIHTAVRATWICGFLVAVTVGQLTGRYAIDFHIADGSVGFDVDKALFDILCRTILRFCVFQALKALDLAEANNCIDYTVGVGDT